MTTKKFDLETYKLEDAQDWHQAYYNNEFYEDCFIPYYWLNPWVNFHHSEGKAGQDDFSYAELEYFEPDLYVKVLSKNDDVMWLFINSRGQWQVSSTKEKNKRMKSGSPPGAWAATIDASASGLPPSVGLAKWHVWDNERHIEQTLQMDHIDVSDLSGKA